LINDNLPESEDEFMKSINIFFPTFSDVRMMIRDNENLFHGGLSKLIMNLDIERKGINHQAGSDAIATIEAYHKLVENGSIDEIKMKNLRNVLYGLGIGEDNENTIKYIKNNISVNYKRFNSEDEKNE
jgi:CCR4-NOT transcription complex subunit 7/8